MAEPTIEEIDKAADGDEDAGEANLRRSYGRTRASHAENYASVGDAEWDAVVLSDEIDRLNRAYLARGKEIEALRKVEEAARACRWDGPTFNLNQLGLRKALDSLDELRRG